MVDRNPPRKVELLELLCRWHHRPGVKESDAHAAPRLQVRREDVQAVLLQAVSEDWDALVGQARSCAVVADDGNLVSVCLQPERDLRRLLPIARWDVRCVAIPADPHCVLLLVPRLSAVARSTYYAKPVFWREQWAALANRIKVVHGQVGGLATDFAPRSLAPDLAAQLAPRWIGVGVRSALLPLRLGCRTMCLASVAHHREDTAVKTGTLEGHAFGNAGSGTNGAITFAR